MIGTTSFYGRKDNSAEDDCDSERKHNTKTKVIKGLPRRLNNLLGPTQVWKVFKKQGEALDFAKRKRSGIMTFAFQQSDGARLFLVAHPKIFWHYDIQKSTSERCSYEVIPESTACKLYFDLEYDTEYNPGRKGPVIVDAFINVVLYFLSKLLKVQVRKEHVLNLDSSTDKKFSCHLIFQLEFHCFSDNQNAGLFVNFIYQKLNLYCETNTHHCVSSELEPHSSTNIGCGCCKISDSDSGCIRDIGLSPDALKDLFVVDRRGNKRLICDLSVYSRNRHFRLFQNTKWGKNSPLIVSKENCYQPKVGKEIHVDQDTFTEAVFLDSLITYFRTSDGNCHEMKVIEFKNESSKYISSNETITCSAFDQSTNILASCSNLEKAIPSTNVSPYPQVDKFINSVVFPGHIWRSTFFNASSVLVYDIIGNRYCHNIKRQHQSNNVKYVVNLITYVYYQKCHDPECSSFHSEHKKLPPEIIFQLDDDIFTSDDVDKLLEEVEVYDNSISESDLIEAVSAVEDLSAMDSDVEF